MSTDLCWPWSPKFTRTMESQRHLRNCSKCCPLCNPHHSKVVRWHCSIYPLSFEISPDTTLRSFPLCLGYTLHNMYIAVDLLWTKVFIVIGICGYLTLPGSTNAHEECPKLFDGLLKYPLICIREPCLECCCESKLSKEMLHFSLKPLV